MHAGLNHIPVNRKTREVVRRQVATEKLLAGACTLLEEGVALALRGETASEELRRVLRLER